MRADEFYDEFKAALRFVNLAWGDKDQAMVWIDGDKLCVGHGGREARIELHKVATLDAPPSVVHLAERSPSGFDEVKT